MVNNDYIHNAYVTMGYVSLIEYHRKNETYNLKHNQTLVSHMRGLHENYIKLNNAMEKRFADYIQKHGSLEDFDLRSNLNELSVAAYDVHHGYTGLGKLATKIIETCDFMNGEPEQSKDTQNKLYRALLILEAAFPQGHSSIGEVKDFKGNDLNVLFATLRNDNQAFGLAAEYADDPKTRAEEKTQYNEMHQTLSTIEKAMFGDNGFTDPVLTTSDKQTNLVPQVTELLNNSKYKLKIAENMYDLLARMDIDTLDTLYSYDDESSQTDDLELHKEARLDIVRQRLKEITAIATEQILIESKTSLDDATAAIESLLKEACEHVKNPSAIISNCRVVERQMKRYALEQNPTLSEESSLTQ